MENFFRNSRFRVDYVWAEAKDEGEEQVGWGKL